MGQAPHYRCNGGSMKIILLVDDDQEVRKTLGEILVSLGYQVIARSDATAALAVLRVGAIVDLVITDYCMPETDGMEFIIQLKRRLPKIPVIMLTGYGAVETYLKALSIGVFEYLNKPIMIKELERIVHAALRSAEECPAGRHDHSVSTEKGTELASQARGEHTCCKFMVGKRMVSCRRSGEVNVPGSSELRDYCHTSMHALRPQHLRGESKCVCIT